MTNALVTTLRKVLHLLKNNSKYKNFFWDKDNDVFTTTAPFLYFFLVLSVPEQERGHREHRPRRSVYSAARAQDRAGQPGTRGRGRPDTTLPGL